MEETVVTIHGGPRAETAVRPHPTPLARDDAPTKTSNCAIARERLSNMFGGLESIIANENSKGPTVVTISASSAASKAKRCGTLTLLPKYCRRHEIAAPDLGFQGGILVTGRRRTA